MVLNYRYMMGALAAAALAGTQADAAPAPVGAPGGPTDQLMLTHAGGGGTGSPGSATLGTSPESGGTGR